MFSRKQTCRGRSQSPVVWIAEAMETKTFEAYRQDLPRGGYESPGRNKSKRIVASKVSIPEGRTFNRRAKAACAPQDLPTRLSTSTESKRQHVRKHMLINCTD